MSLRPGSRANAARSCALVLSALLEPGQAVRLGEEVRGAHAVVAHQAEQRGAVAQPVAFAEPRRLAGVDVEMRGHVVGHRDVQLAERGVACIMQRVVEVQEPDGMLQCERIIVP